MSDFFPTDVRVRISRDGDQALFGQARKVLFHALNMQGAGSSLPITVVQRGEDGTTITAQIGVGYKNVTISTPPPVKEEPKPILEISPKDEATRAATMLSGWTMKATISGDTLTAFHPTRNCAAAYNIPYAWQTNRKLATTPNQLRAVKPSMFSGTIKRIVQAMLGMGIIKDRSPLYFGGAITAPRQEIVSYGYVWDRTHGIYKSGTKNHWLVEISKTRGILAMPLPLLLNTRSPQFRALVRSRKDNGTLQMLDEFGGLPSGEDFPATGTPLENAISAGKVLRLLTATDLEPFYTDGNAWHSGSGWAFSESGAKAHNTCWRNLALDDRCYTGNVNYNRTPGYRFSRTIWGEHWGINLALDAHGGAIPPTGSASLSLVDRGRVEPYSVTAAFLPADSDMTADNKLTRAGFGPKSPAELYSLWDYRAWTTTAKPLFAVQGTAASYLYERWGCTISAFFDGERLETLRWIPHSNGVVWLVGSFVGTSVRVDTQGVAAGSAFPSNAFIPRYCREGYVLWRGRGDFTAPVVTTAYFSGVGIVSLNPLPVTPPVQGKVLPINHPLLVEQHPYLWYFKSYAQYDAAINAGPDKQFFMHNGARCWPAFSGTVYPSGPPHEFVSFGTPDGIETIHPYEFNYVGGHPEGTE
ncbi:MAG TPA: hypothetical protein PKV98_14650 [Burkholderiaceae bacterium]|nr:hypothetical protein [Burkholderiaceae bacterium]